MGIRLPRERVGVRQQLVAELGVAPADGFHLGAVRPRHVLPPDPAVRAEDRAEGAQLEPARVELARLRHRMEEAADVRAPVRNPGQTGVEPQRDLGLEGREVVVDVARPARRPVALHSRRAGPAEQEHPLVGAIGRLALRERLMAVAIVNVVEERPVARLKLRRRRRPLPAVEPPPGDPEPPQVLVRSPPPATHGRIGEVEVALAFAVRRGGAPAGGHALVPRRQEIAARLRLGEQRGVLVEHRVLVGDELEVLGPGLPEDAGGIRPELRLELEVPDPAVPPVRLAVRREIDEAVAGDALVPDGARQLAQLGRVVEVPRGLEEPERPARGHRGAAEQLRDLAHHRAEILADQEVPGEPPGLRRVDDAHAVVGAPHRQAGVAGVVEEHRVPAVRDEERHAHVRARAVAEVRVPELPAHAEPVELGAALAEPVEVLLAIEDEARVEARPAIRGPLRRHPAVRRLPEEPLARGVQEGQADRRGRDLHAEIARRQPQGLAIVEIHRRAGPVAGADVGRRRVLSGPFQVDPHDARRADRDGHARRALAEPHGGSVPLESRRGPRPDSQALPPRSNARCALDRRVGWPPGPCDLAAEIRTPMPPVT